MAHDLGEFLFPEPAPARPTATGIVSWWERRRAFYNVAVGSAGLVTATIGSALVSLAERELFIIPWQAVVVFGLGANVCYFFGPLAEIAIDRVSWLRSLIRTLWGRSVPAGPALYRMGLTFSVGLALLPLIPITLITLIRIFLDANFP